MGGSHDSSSRSWLHDVAPVSIRITTPPPSTMLLFESAGRFMRGADQLRNLLAPELACAAGCGRNSNKYFGGFLGFRTLGRGTGLGVLIILIIRSTEYEV